MCFSSFWSYSKHFCSSKKKREKTEHHYYYILVHLCLMFHLQYKSMDIFHPFHLLPGENRQAHPKKSFTLMLTALYSQGVQIFLLSKTKKKRYWLFCSTVIFSMVVIKASVRLQWKCMRVYFLSNTLCSSCPAGLCGGSCSVRYLQSAVKGTQ